MAAEPRSRRAAVPWLAALGIAALVAVVVGVGTTRQRISDNESAQVLKILRELLPDGSFDNRPDEDRVLLSSPELLGSEQPLPAYRARRAGELGAVVLSTIARSGYLGPIHLLVALDPAGRVLAVRVTAHQETPALGGQIGASDSDWMERFKGRSLDDPPAVRWALRRDGGDFDQITGATVTSRAVVIAVRDAAEFFRIHHDQIVDAPAAGHVP